MICSRGRGGARMSRRLPENTGRGHRTELNCARKIIGWREVSQRKKIGANK
jgi:hypothetical protein